MSVEAAAGERVEVRSCAADGSVRLQIRTRHGVPIANVKLDRWAALQHADDTVDEVRSPRQDRAA